jgi:hypothetical protein
MNVGLPGTGIGSLFYILLVLAMPLRELWVRMAGRGVAKPWAFIARQCAMAVGMLCVFWFETRLIASGIQGFGHLHGGTPGVSKHAAIGHFLTDQASRSAVASLTMMVALLLVVHGVAWLNVVRARQRA